MAALTWLERAHENVHRYRWYALGLATYSHGSVMALAMAVGPLAPLLQADFDVTRAEIGLAVTSVYLSYAFVGPMAGRVADRIGERRVLIASSLVAGLGALLLARVSTVGAFLAISFVIGLGSSIQNPVGTAVVVRWFPARMRGTAMGIRQAGVPIGGIVAATLWPLIAVAHGWRTAYVVGGIVVLLAGALLTTTYRDPAPTSATRVVRPPSFRKLLSDRRVWWLGLLFNGMVMAQFTTGAYLTLFLHEAVGVPVVAASAMLGVVNGAAIVSRIVWGVVSDRWFAGRRRPVLVIVVVLTVISMLGAAVLPAGAPMPVIVLLAVLLGFSSFAWGGIGATLVVETVGRESAATSLALVTSLNSPASLLGPPLFGYVVDQTGSYQPAWLLTAVTVLLGLVALGKVDERNRAAASVK